MMHDKLTKINWYEGDLFDLVLRLYENLVQQTEKNNKDAKRFFENPEITGLVNLLTEAKLTKKKTGIHKLKLDDEIVSFWKKKFMINGQEHYLDQDFIE